MKFIISILSLGALVISAGDLTPDLALSKSYRAKKALRFSQQAIELREVEKKQADALADVAYFSARVEWMEQNKPSDKKGIAELKKGLKKAQTLLAEVEKEKSKITGDEAEEPSAVGLVMPNDTVEIYVNEDSSFDGIYQVRRGGHIIIPRLGRIQVAGYSVEMVEAALKGYLESTFLRKATVIVELQPREQVLLKKKEEKYGFLHYGELLGTDGHERSRVSAGSLALEGVGGASLVSTIIRNGGASRSADLENVKVLRLIEGKPLMETVNIDAVLAGEELASDLTLEKDDIVIIPTRVGKTDEIYITEDATGEAKILPLSRDEEITVYTAVLRSGGFRRFANLKKVYILRDEGEGIRIKIPVNVKKVTKGLGADLVLQSGDIVVIPEKFWCF